MLPEGTMEEWVGAVVLFVLGLGWAIYQKYLHRIEFKTALESPPGVSEAAIKARIAEGKGASII
jgi:hypothetical protein